MQLSKYLRMIGAVVMMACAALAQETTNPAADMPSLYEIPALRVSEEWHIVIPFIRAAMTAPA